MLAHFHLPHFFASKIRKEIEHLYASVAIGNLAQSIIGLFEPIFLYTVLGFTILEVLLFYGAVYALYTIALPFGGKIASRFGYAHAIFFSIPFQIAYWFFLLGSQHNLVFLCFAAVAIVLQKILFWPAFHASLARFADGQQRGREFSLIYAIMSLMQILGPMMGGFLSSWLGINAILILSSIVYFCSAIPLFLTHEVFVPKLYKFHDTWQLYKTYPAKFIGYFAFGEELLVMTIWPIFIYLIVKSYEDTGTLVTIASFIATALALYIGIYTDSHSKRRILHIGAGFYALSWLARIPVIGAFGAFITDALSRTSKSLVFIPMSALTYERAETTHIMPYIIGAEQMLSFGKFLAAMLAIIVFALTGSFMALFVVGAIFTLFYFLL